MKFSFKIYMICIIFLAASFSIGCSVLIRLNFKSSLKQEIDNSIETSQMIQFAFETAVLNIPMEHGNLTDDLMIQISSDIEESISYTDTSIQLSNEEKRLLFTSGVQNYIGQSDYAESEQKIKYQIIKKDNHYYLLTAIRMSLSDHMFHMGTQRNIDTVFLQRDSNVTIYQWLMAFLMLLGSLVMLFLSHWLSKPVEKLSRAARAISKGELKERVDIAGEDEIGQFADDFNKMAEALEEHVRQKERFVADFSHELKTPLTSMIGYADMLRSRTLEETDQKLAANYIYREGKRLEMLSYKLMELIGMKESEFEKKTIAADYLFESIAFVFTPALEKKQIELEVSCEDGKVFGEVDLLKLLFTNLIDNAIKASEKNSKILFAGTKREKGYQISVRDFGYGITGEELSKITNAFYMVDKNRSREQNGFGLGLALCVQIAEYHHTRLEFESQPGLGTKVTVFLEEAVDESE